MHFATGGKEDEVIFVLYVGLEYQSINTCLIQLVEQLITEVKHQCSHIFQYIRWNALVNICYYYTCHLSQVPQIIYVLLVIIINCVLLLQIIVVFVDVRTSLPVYMC